MNSKYVILFHFESKQGGKVALPPSNKGEQEIFRDDKGCNWIQNGIKILNSFTHISCSELELELSFSNFSTN